MGAHLHRIFRKLGITSRVTLGEALAALPPQPSRAERSPTSSQTWLSGLAGVGREAIGELDDEVAQFSGALDDERPTE